MGNYSFGIETAYDLYGKLKREHAAFVQNRSDSDIAWNCAVTGWHITEWVWKERLKGRPTEHVKLLGRSFADEAEYRVELQRRVPDYQVLREICNGAKHFRVDRPVRVDSTEVHPGAFLNAFMLNTVACNEVPFLIINLSGGRVLRFAELIEQVVNLWDDVFRLGP